jgi:hypothetical protein
MDGLVHELADHPSPAFLENILRVMQHIVQQWQAEFDWVKSLHEVEMKTRVEEVPPQGHASTIHE